MDDKPMIELCETCCSWDLVRSLNAARPIQWKLGTFLLKHYQ
jgi:hypothetical protein